jgi:hypothetical protein
MIALKNIKFRTVQNFKPGKILTVLLGTLILSLAPIFPWLNRTPPHPTGRITYISKYCT